MAGRDCHGTWKYWPASGPVFILFPLNFNCEIFTSVLNYSQVCHSKRLLEKNLTRSCDRQANMQDLNFGSEFGELTELLRKKFFLFLALCN